MQTKSGKPLLKNDLTWVFAIFLLCCLLSFLGNENGWVAALVSLP